MDISLLHEVWESRGPVQSNHCDGTGRRVRLSGISLCLNRLVSRQIAAVHIPNAASDGAFGLVAVVAPSNSSAKVESAFFFRDTLA
jgi:hypothetical protein